MFSRSSASLWIAALLLQTGFWQNAILAAASGESIGPGPRSKILTLADLADHPTVSIIPRDVPGADHKLNAAEKDNLFIIFVPTMAVSQSGLLTDTFPEATSTQKAESGNPPPLSTSLSTLSSTPAAQSSTASPPAADILSSALSGVLSVISSQGTTSSPATTQTASGTAVVAPPTTASLIASTSRDQVQSSTSQFLQTPQAISAAVSSTASTQSAKPETPSAKPDTTRLSTTFGTHSDAKTASTGHTTTTPQYGVVIPGTSPLTVTLASPSSDIAVADGQTLSAGGPALAEGTKTISMAPNTSGLVVIEASSTRTMAFSTIHESPVPTVEPFTGEAAGRGTISWSTGLLVVGSALIAGVLA